MKQRIVDFLPPLYEGLLPVLFHARIPVERLAACEDCAMCRRPGEPPVPAARYFRPDARCCTYYPSLPNYLAGALLEDPVLAEGGRRVRGLLRGGRTATAQSLASPRGYDRVYHRLGDYGFGRWRGLLCPYFRRGPNDCAIWPYRNAVCATYFCRHVRGLHGEAFWRAVRKYLGTVEKSLSAYAVRRIGGAARSRELEPVYRAAFRVVRGLGSRAVEQIGGAEAHSALEEVDRSLQRMLSPRLPGELRVDPRVRVRLRREGVYLAVPGYITYCLPRFAWDALRNFGSGAEWRVVLDGLRREQGLTVSRGLLLALYRAGILTPANIPSCRVSSSRPPRLSGPWRRPSCSGAGP